MHHLVRELTASFRATLFFFEGNPNVTIHHQTHMQLCSCDITLEEGGGGARTNFSVPLTLSGPKSMAAVRNNYDTTPLLGEKKVYDLPLL